ncbi:hypothetical protein [Nostoc sp.]|uniref:hypothetical protein n=1 Tax=Nostoc sp. TaxID=1180 RepID=UPI002FFA0A73
MPTRGDDGSAWVGRSFAIAGKVGGVGLAHGYEMKNPAQHAPYFYDRRRHPGSPRY